MLSDIKRSDVILYCDNVSKKIGKRVILDQISFDILPNTINFIIGPNSAGKTTLGKILTGYDQQFTGKIINKVEEAQQFISQSIEINKYLPLSVEAFINMFEHFKCEDFIDFINCNDIRNKQLHELSTGQLQKLFLVSALSISSKLIVFDEPTASLDPTSCRNFFLLLKKYTSTTFVVISHDLHMVSSFADQVICINKHVCCIKKDIKLKSRSDNLIEDFIRFYHSHDHSHD